MLKAHRLAVLAFTCALGTASLGAAEAESTAAPAAGAKPAATKPAATKPAAKPAAKDDKPSKASLYKKWKDGRLGDADTQRMAFETGQEFLKLYGPDDDQYTKAVAGWVQRYERAILEFEFAELASEGKHAEAFEAGAKILKAEPQELKTLITLAMTGLAASTSGNTALRADTAKYAEQVLSLLKAGKTLDDWRPVTSKDDAIGWMHYVLGVLDLRQDTQRAATHLLAAIEVEGAVKNDPQAYYSLASAWMTGEYDKMSEDYTKRFSTGAKSAESDAAYAKLNVVLDRILQVQAKAIAMARAQGDTGRANTWLDELKDLYRSRHDGSDTGLSAFIDGALSAPVPRPS